MNGVLSWPVVLVLAAGGGTLYLVYYLCNYWEKPGARWFVVTLAAQAVFCFAYGIGLTVFDPGLRWGLEVLACIGLSWLGVPFLGFALEYTGRGKLLDSWYYRSLYALPVSVAVLLPFNRRHALFWSDFEIDPVFGLATVSYTFEPLAYVAILGGLTAAGVATLLLVDTVLSYGPLYRTEALAVALSPVPPTIGLVPWLFGLGPAPQLNTIALCILPHVALDAYAFVGSGMFTFHPATNRAAERSAFEELRSPVFVLDETGRIVTLNGPATELIDGNETEAITRPLSEVIGEGIDPGETDRRLSLSTGGRRLEFYVESSPLSDSGDNHVGYILLFQDVTEEVRRKEEIAVLNRVLRHNLRNDLNVVIGRIKLADGPVTGDEQQAHLTTARKTAEELADLGEKACDLETVIQAETSVRPCSISTVVETVVENQAADHPGATFALTDEAVPIHTRPQLMTAALENVLENAVVHNDAPSPTVEIAVEASPDGVRIVVEDDGPGIPDYEIRALDGTETPLEHGSGLGLWLVHWAIRQLGGTVEFESTDDGTRVLLRIPDLREVDATGTNSAVIETHPDGGGR